MTGAGLALVAGALVGIGGLGVDEDYPRLVVFLGVFGLGLGICATPATAAIVRGVPRAKQGVASAVNDVTRELGAAVGIALAGSLLASSYRTHLASAITHLPAAARAQASDSLAAALRLAGDTPAGPGLAAAARRAFVDGFHDTLSTLAVITAVTAVALTVWAPGRHRVDGPWQPAEARGRDATDPSLVDEQDRSTS